MAHEVVLGWAASSDAAANPSLTYNVYRGLNSTSLVKIASGVAALTYSDSDPSLVPGAYYYTVTSELNGAESAQPTPVSAVIPPAPPTDLVVTSVT